MPTTATRTACEVALESEADAVIRWRREQLQAVGYDHRRALVVALHHDVDLHLACSLVEAGCEPATALRILL